MTLREAEVLLVARALVAPPPPPLLLPTKPARRRQWWEGADLGRLDDRGLGSAMASLRATHPRSQLWSEDR